MLPSFCKDTVTRIRPGSIESRGSTIPDWSPEAVDEKTITGCSMQPANTSLSQDGRVLGLLDEYTLFTPPDADIKVIISFLRAIPMKSTEMSGCNRQH